MEKVYNLPPGFRFHPTDEELITRYLSPKVLDSTFESTTIVEVDFNKVEPWDLPWKAKIGEEEWYFFCVRDRKYPNGSRANRATCSGYWKATGKDKEIFRAKKLVGMKKTLVFYKGRAPKGEKSNWVMHEYRLQGNNSPQNLNKIAKSEWVICRVFNKSGGGKKVHKDSRLDSPPKSCDEDRKVEGFDHVTCFSNPEEDSQIKSFDEYTPTPTPDSILSMPDQSMLQVLLESNDVQNGAKTEFSGDIGINCDAFNHELGFKIYNDDEDDQDFPIDCLWNY